MQNRFKSKALALYGLIVVGSGMLRYFGQDGGETGLWFGIVMGTLALIAAAFFKFDRKLPGHLIVWPTIAIVGGWFFYEALIKKGFAHSETRQLVVIAVSVALAVAMALPGRNKAQLN